MSEKLARKESEMDEKPFWLWLVELDETLRFAEEDDEDDDDEGDEGDEEDSEDEDDDSEDDDDKGKKGKRDDNTGLKSALQKERAARKKNDKELKALRKTLKDQEDKDKTDAEKAKDQSAADRAKAEKLAAKLLNNAVDTAIIKGVAKVQLPDGARFADVDDVLKLLDRDLLDVQQDEDDPAEVEIDDDKILRQLKKLAKNKPHLLIKSESDEDDDEEDDEDEEDGVKPSRKATGSKAGSRGNRKSKKLKEEELKGRYPMLNR